MPYLSKAARERARWMTLREALVHIGTLENCSLKAAWNQLREAIIDGEVRAFWIDLGPKAYAIAVGRWIDETPSDTRFWESARIIFTGEGRILDDPAVHSTEERLKLVRTRELRYRPVKVLREGVEKIWPKTNEPSNLPGQTVDFSAGAAVEHRLTPPQLLEATEAQIRQVAREVYADPANNRPNMEKTWRLIRAKLSNARRKRTRKVLAEDVFKKERKKAGKQPKG
jgi:hypothetical protein